MHLRPLEKMNLYPVVIHSLENQQRKIKKKVLKHIGSFFFFGGCPFQVGSQGNQKETPPHLPPTSDFGSQSSPELNDLGFFSVSSDAAAPVISNVSDPASGRPAELVWCLVGARLADWILIKTLTVCLVWFVSAHMAP